MNRRSLLLYRRVLKTIDDDLSLYKYRKANEVRWLFEGYRGEKDPREVKAVHAAIEEMIKEMKQGRYPQAVPYFEDDVLKANYQMYTIYHRSSFINTL
jgi:lauroyl/myristoyl acyltransferase